MVGLLLCGYGRWNLGGESNWGGAEEVRCMNALERKCGLVCNPYDSFDMVVLTNTGGDCKGAVIIHEGEVKPILHMWYLIT